MLTVACVNWNNYRGEGDKYVAKLRSMVAKHLTIPHEFRVFTEREIPSHLFGWWAKLYLLKAGLFYGQVLYLDLDVVLTSNIDAIVEKALTDRTRVWMRDDFSYSIRKPKQGLSAKDQEFLGGIGTCNSSVMCWHSDAGALAYSSFNFDVTQKVHGDQNWISKTLYPDRIGFLPDELVGSYKYGKLREEPLRPVMVFHGEPKVPDLPPKHELRKLWEAA